MFFVLFYFFHFGKLKVVYVKLIQVANVSLKCFFPNWQHNIVLTAKLLSSSETGVTKSICKKLQCYARLVTCYSNLREKKKGGWCTPC